MQKFAKRSKRRRLVKIAGISIVSAGFLWLVILAFYGNDSPALRASNTMVINDGENIVGSQQRELLMRDEILHAHFNELQRLDEAYAALAIDTTKKSKLIDLNAKIASEEEAFRVSIDSIGNEMLDFANKADENLFVNMITSFRLALENRYSLKNLRNALSKEKLMLNPDQKELLMAKNAILTKDTKIASLENALKLLQNTVDTKSAAAINEAKEETSAYKQQSLEKDKRIATLTSLNSNLQSQNNSLQSRNNTLQSQHSSLQKEYDRVAKQGIDAAKSVENSDNSVKTRNAILEKKIDELNTELGLAQVDCNLVRADASQIISSSKQRRMLLSEALTILNGLSRSENAAIQKKVQDKKNRLSQVAGNFRD
ncbi:MAG: hypothetical protein JWP81_3956 [Ferruginibacter sp.]|nr:hypothetical protein [Ferruginibacter sp.]